MSKDDHIGKPWDRRKGETAKAFRAFVAYLELGPDRSIPKAMASIGASTGSLRYWEVWSSKNGWKSRAEAWDSDQLLDRISQRSERREEVRQRVYDEAERILDDLVKLQQGEMPDGDTIAIYDKHHKVIGRRPIVDARVRSQAAQALLGLAGIIAPKRIELTGAEGDELRLQVRTGLAGIDRAMLLRWAKDLGIEI